MDFSGIGYSSTDGIEFGLPGSELFAFERSMLLWSVVIAFTCEFVVSCNHTDEFVVIDNFAPGTFALNRQFRGNKVDSLTFRMMSSFFEVSFFRTINAGFIMCTSSGSKTRVLGDILFEPAESLRVFEDEVSLDMWCTFLFTDFFSTYDVVNDLGVKLKIVCVFFFGIIVVGEYPRSNFRIEPLLIIGHFGTAIGFLRVKSCIWYIWNYDSVRMAS